MVNLMWQYVRMIIVSYLSHLIIMILEMVMVDMDVP